MESGNCNKIEAKTIIEALRKRHPKDQWAFFPELRIGTGAGKDAEQRLDVWAIAYWPSTQGIKRVAYEVKVSRSDFLAELKNPLKRRRALLLSNEFYFAAPKGLIGVSELPPEAGLVEVDPEFRQGFHTLVAAPWRDIPPPSWRFVASIARLAMK